MLAEIFCTLCLLSFVFILRCFFLINTIRKCRSSIDAVNDIKAGISCMAVLGSGGHTAEILRLIGVLNLNVYSPRYYIIANTDKISEEKVVKFEREQKRNTSIKKNYEICYIPRSREVMQSWFSTVITTFFAIVYSFPLVFMKRPKLLLVNGPGTCIPICIAAFLLTTIGIKVTIVFVESLCRVKTMSLSGKILYYFADHLLVQWPELKTLYPEAQYLGRIV